MRQSWSIVVAISCGFKEVHPDQRATSTAQIGSCGIVFGKICTVRIFTAKRLRQTR
jgi:K+ transporter